MNPLEIIVIHEFNGQKYFEALQKMDRLGTIDSLQFREASVLKLFVKNVFLEKQPFLKSAEKALNNLIFRLKLFSVRKKVIILAIPPWDYRLLWYYSLGFQNKVMYHTSWPDWNQDSVPRTYGPFSFLMRKVWLNFLHLPNVMTITVVPEVASSIKANICVDVYRSIPHVVSPQFSRTRKDSQDCKFGVLFVGELSKKKGVESFIDLSKSVDSSEIYFSVVGNGILRPLVESACKDGSLEYFGRVSDRKKLAEIFSRHDVLVVPSRRTRKWQELFGIVIIEAMASGLPVIASDHIGPSAIIKDAWNGFLLEENSLHEFERAILSLYDDRKMWREMSNNALESYQDFSMESVIEKWNDLFMSLNEM